MIIFIILLGLSTILMRNLLEIEGTGFHELALSGFMSQMKFVHQEAIISGPKS